MPHYASDLSVREARAQYFAANGLGDGGYQDPWVRFNIGPFYLWMPNTKARVAAVRFHDIHHVLTGYDTSWLGEAKIAAWEISTGCARHYAAWFLNLAAMAIGLGIDIESVAQAFWRGRRSSNLYREAFDETLLSSSVGSLQSKLGLDQSPPPTNARDLVQFGAWAVMSWLTLIAIVAIGLLPIYTTWLFLF